MATPFQDYTQDYECPGELHFRLKGKKMTLRPFTSGDNYFIIIYDETSGGEGNSLALDRPVIQVDTKLHVFCYILSDHSGDFNSIVLRV